MVPYYPVFLTLEGKAAMVIGGGDVAERKVETLLESGAIVTVISPELTPGLQKLAKKGNIKVLSKEYSDGDLEGAYIIVAATDDREVNRKASLEARRRGLLVNAVDDVAYCDFIAPSIIRRGELVIAISTGGLSPAMARKAREELDALVPPDYGDLLTVLAQVRQDLLSHGVRPDPDRWQWGIDERLRTMIRDGQLEAARERLRGFLEAEFQEEPTLS